MANSLQNRERLFLGVIAICGLFALPAQLYLAILNRQAGVGETIIRFFSYFTILTNLLVFILCLALLFPGHNRLHNFFERPTTRTAMAVYITIVGLVYNAILASQWNPQGLQKPVDQVLHTIVPILYVIYWLVYVRTFRLEWRHILPWMLYPLLYCIYTLLRGPLAGFYPYPFIDVDKLGYTQVLLNISKMIVAFLFVSAVFVAATRIIHPE